MNTILRDDSTYSHDPYFCQLNQTEYNLKRTLDENGFNEEAVEKNITEINRYIEKKKATYLRIAEELHLLSIPYQETYNYILKELCYESPAISFQDYRYRILVNPHMLIVNNTEFKEAFGDQPNLFDEQELHYKNKAFIVGDVRVRRQRAIFVNTDTRCTYKEFDIQVVKNRYNKEEKWQIL